MKLKYFGTDGIRGPYGSDVLNDGVAYRAGRAAVLVARRVIGAERPLVLVGRDTRASGKRLLAAFARGVAAEGGRTQDLGVAPTPCVAYAAKGCGADLACSITASHNPAGDNGIKFFQGDGVKPSEALEQALDSAVGEVDAVGLREDAAVEVESATTDCGVYAAAIEAKFPGRPLAGLRVALDCANGAMSRIAPALFEALGAEVVAIACSPDGGNINAGVGSEHPESLLALFGEGRFDVGFAFDGDGDRVVVSDESGKRIAGEALLAALAIDAAESGELPGNVLVTTVQSNLGLDAALKRRGIGVLRTDVGDKHIARLMLAEGYQVGGEESGHVVLGAFAVTGDGLFAAATLASIVAKSGRPASAVVGTYAPFPQVSLAVKVAAKPPLESCPRLVEAMAKLERKLCGEGRFLVRYSGTESKLRLLVEAKTEEMAREAMDALLAAARQDIPVL